MPDFDNLTMHHARVSDEELVEALRVGEQAYEPGAWRVIQQEFARRNLADHLSSSPSLADPTGGVASQRYDSEGSPDAAFTVDAHIGQRITRRISIVLGVVAVLSLFTAPVRGEAIQTLDAIRSVLFVLLAIRLAQGQNWARLISAVFLLLAAVIAMWRFLQIGAAHIPTALLLATFAFACGYMALTLLRSHTVKAFFAQGRRR